MADVKKGYSLEVETPNSNVAILKLEKEARKIAQKGKLYIFCGGKRRVFVFECEDERDLLATRLQELLK